MAAVALVLLMTARPEQAGGDAAVVGVVDRDETYQFLIEEQVDRFLDGLSHSQAECRFVGHGNVRQRLNFRLTRPYQESVESSLTMLLAR